MRRLITAVVLASPLAGQGPDIASLLRSDELVDRAWGAHHAGRSAEIAWTDPLWQAFLATEGDTTAAVATRQAIASALVDVGAVLEDAQLRRLAATHLVEALIFAAHDPELHRDMLVEQLERELDITTWTALCGLLRDFAPVELARHLARDLEVTLQLVVDDSDSFAIKGAAALHEFGAGFDVPPGFPPIELRTLQESGTSPHELVGGLFPVTVRTTAVEPGVDTALHRSLYPRTRAERGLAMLQVLANTPVPLQARPRVLIRWRDANDYLEHARAALAAANERLDQLFDALIAVELLTADEAVTLRRPVAIDIDDRRAEPTSLPEFEARDPGLVRIGLIAWHTDYDAALALAKRLDRPLLLHFGENPG